MSLEQDSTLSIANVNFSDNEILSGRGIQQDEEENYKQIAAMKKSYSDPNILHTFVTMDKKLSVSLALKGNHTANKKEYYSLFCLGPTNPIRLLAILITESKLFEYFILLAILFTCVVMAIDAPLPENDKSETNKIANQIEYYLLAIFSIEAILKIIAMGFVLHPNSYLRSIWNVLDFIVVVTGILTLEEVVGNKAGVNIKPLRAVRVLRPLKLISGIPSLQVVMTSIVRAMFPLLQVLFLVVFVIIIYAIIGLEFFEKRFHYNCYSNKTEEFDKHACDIAHEKQRIYYVYGRKCPKDSQCKKNWPGINYGITSFDNIFLAMITVFQCITMEGWTQMMYYTFYAMDESGYIFAIYYISLIVIGSFFMLNLVLGVLSGEFAKEREKVENRRAFLKLRYEQQLERVCESYMDWLQKGDDVTIHEQNELKIHSDTIQELAENVTVNPALVFTATKELNIKTANHKKSKLDRLLVSVKMLRIKIRNMVKHQYFFWTVVCMVLINTIIMATRHYRQPAWLSSLQEYAEQIFVSIFILEVLLKLFAHGFVSYCKSHFNVFDLVVVLLSIMEIILNKTIGNINLGLSVLRCLRLLRVFRVTKYWSSLRNLVTSLMNAMKSILSLMFLLFLFIVISALLGMQLFGGKFVKLEKFPRTNFDTFPDSLLAVFQVITGEDWNTVMYDGMMAYGGPRKIEGVLCSLYFIFLVIFGNYTLLNVFLAIAVDNLTNAEILTHDEEEEESKSREKKFLTLLHTNKTLKSNANKFVTNLHAKALTSDIEGNATPPIAIKDMTNDSNEEIYKNGHVNGTMSTLSPLGHTMGNPLPAASPGERRKSEGMFKQALLDGSGACGKGSSTEKYLNAVQKKWLAIVDYNREHPDDFLNGNTNTTSSENNNTGKVLDDENGGENPNSDEENIEKQIRKQGMINVMKVNVTNRRRIVKNVPMVQKSSLFLLSPNNRFRHVCHQIIHFQYFDWFIMAVILLSSITLALEDPLDENAEINKVLRKFDYFFTVVFGTEVILKIIDDGFILHKDAYMRNPWNVLDAFVFVCNLLSIILNSYFNSYGTSSYHIIRALRVLRVLRPLKAIHKVKKLKAVFQCMVYSLKNVTFVLIITFIILFIFACIGVQLFKGKFFYCTDLSKLTEEECQGEFYVFPNAASVVENKPQVKEREWKRHKFHFDDIVNALLTLYTSSTGEGWPNSMHNTMDATKEDRGPQTNNNPHMAIFYIVFVVIFTFMIINIYIALIILTFQRQGEKEIDGGLDRNQRDCLQFVLNAKPRQRYMPKDKKSLTYHVWYVVDSRLFEYFIMALIILNTLQLMMKYEGNSESYEEMLRSLNIAFTALFCIEATLKIVAYRLNYFKDLWNVFDLLVITGSMLDIILSCYENSTEIIIDPSMFRLCRAARIVKLLRKGTSIRIMLWTFLQSFKALPYVTTLILLLFYLYAVIGMQLFGKISTEDDTREIHTYNNFQAIIPALQVLLRCSTGESWSAIMHACYDEAPCQGDPKAKCGNTLIAQFYFSSFIFLCMFLLLNLFVAVIMDNFEYLTRDSSILGPHHLDEFVRCWSEFDPQASGTIPYDMLYKMLCHLTPPVGFGKKCPKEIAYKRLIRMNMPVDDQGMVSFASTLLALIRTSLDVYVKGNMFDNDKELRRIMASLWPKDVKRLDKILPKIKAGDDTQLTVGKIYCVQLIIMKYRFAKRKPISDKMESKKSPPSVFKRLNTLISSIRRGKDPKPETNDDIELTPSHHFKRNKTLSARLNKLTTQHDNPHHTRDNQLRRRSSWSDLPSFLKFGKDTHVTKAELKNELKTDSRQSSTMLAHTNKNTNFTTQVNRNDKLQKPGSLNRAPSLRTNSNGNVVPTSQRRVTNSGQSLQYEPINKGSSVRYQVNKYNRTRQTYPNSAPTTPRGTHGPNVTSLTRQSFDFRKQIPGSPLTRRANPSVPSYPGGVVIRKGNLNPSNSLPDTRDHYTNNCDVCSYENHETLHENSHYESYGSRARSISDPRKYMPHHSQVRQELSKENLETFDHYGSAIPLDSIRRGQRGGEHCDRKYPPPPDSRFVQNENARFHSHPYDDNKYCYDTSQDGRCTKVNADRSFKSADSLYTNMRHEKNSDLDYRLATGDSYRRHGMPSIPKQGQLYRNEYVSGMSEQNLHQHNRRGSNSPRGNHMNQGGHMSPDRYYIPNNNELINGMTSQQYYEDMISQISTQIARVSEGGAAATQSFNTKGSIHHTSPTTAGAAADYDDNEWC